MPLDTRTVALLLPGQGSQHPGMARELYDGEPAFGAVMDEFFALMGHEGKELRADWLSARPRIPLDDASRAQPLLFAIGYAAGRALASYGVRPTALLGHSVGELAAAALAGVFSLADAARLMSARSAAMAATGPGGMLAVAARPEELAELLAPRPEGPGAPTVAQPAVGTVTVGAVNAPAHTVLSGPEPDLTRVERALKSARVATRRVPARQAFHCPAVAGAADAFRAAFRGVALNSPSIRVWSTRTGLPVRPHQAVDPGFWAGQLATPVLFWPALDGLLRHGRCTLVETGPGQGLSMLARRHPRVRARHSEVVPLLPPRPGGDVPFFRSAASRLLA
ncbi:acyltransferase domain-containing protein [Streptomyces sp. NPDC053474]|uniref:acyltransferase domain-containing protein n=1 Tax=Streptomyces sp. NPDC053474 TaxID=3365704 RepID=UPI0037D8DB8A